MNLKRMTALFSTISMCSGMIITSNVAFATTGTDTHQETQVKATVTVDKLPDKPDLPSGDPDDHTDDKNTDQHTTTSPVSIAYQPVAFTGTGTVSNNGKAIINLKVSDINSGHQSNIGHVGVKDQTKSKNHWSLKASFITSSPELKGSSIEFKHGTVKMSNNGTLSNLVNGEVTGVANPNISNTPVTIMSAVTSKVQYGVYDYGFKDITLNIPDSSNLVSGSTYAGIVNWDLSEVPTS